MLYYDICNSYIVKNNLLLLYEVLSSLIQICFYHIFTHVLVVFPKHVSFVANNIVFVECTTLT